MSTLDGIEDDLRIAVAKINEIQEKIITALEERAPAATVAELETALGVACKERDELVGTREFVINKERERVVRDNKPMCTLLYVSKFSDTFTADLVPSLVFQSNAQNERWGLTGILYILRGWFASYIEGDADAIDHLIRRLRRDDRHTNFTILNQSSGLNANTRRFPKSGLVVKHLDDDQQEHQAHPETTMIRQLTLHLSLAEFVPPLAWNMQPQLSAGPIVAKRYLMRVTPMGSLWNLPEQTQLQAIARVTEVVTAIVTRGGVHCEGSVISPHNDYIDIMFDGVSEVVLERVLMTFDGIRYDDTTYGDRTIHSFSVTKREDSELFMLYRPIVAVHYGDAEIVMNGKVTVVGSMNRHLRQLTSIAEQEGIPIIFSSAVVNEATEIAATSIGHYSFDKLPDEVFAPNTLAAMRWQDVVEAAEKKKRDEQLREHIEGGGPVAQHSVPRTRKPVEIVTNEDLRLEPVKGLISEDELRTQFNQFGPDEDDTIPADRFNAVYFGTDTMGVTEQVSEMEGRLKQFSSTSGKRIIKDDKDIFARLTFDQFCLIMYRKERD